MTIFLAGASGLVGSAFARAAAPRGHRVVATVGQYPGEIEGLAAQRRVDLTSEMAVTAAVLDEFPQVIVNCAAIALPATSLTPVVTVTVYPVPCARGTFGVNVATCVPLL